MFTAVGDYSPMLLTPEQCWQIAAVFASSAVDMRVPPPQRAAFARKADWFRMLARIGAKKAAAASKEERPQTLAELLKRVRAAAGA